MSLIIFTGVALGRKKEMEEDGKNEKKRERERERERERNLSRTIFSDSRVPVFSRLIYYGGWTLPKMLFRFFHASKEI
jgi:hypothetical protein